MSSHVDAGGFQSDFDVSHRRLRLFAEVVATDEPELLVERDLAGEMHDLRARGDRDMAEAWRRMEIRWVDELTVV